MRPPVTAVTFRASSLGDCLMGKYLLENVHEAYPEARLALVVGNKAEVIQDLLKAYPWLEVIVASKRNIPGIVRLCTRFFRSDLVVTQYSGKGGAFSTATKMIARLLAKPGKLYGFHDAWKFNHVVYDTLLPFSTNVATVEHEREVLRKAGIPIVLAHPTYSYIPTEDTLEKFGLVPGGYVVLHLFSGGIKRGLTFDKKRELLAQVLERVGAVPLVLTAAPFEAQEMQEVSEGFDVVRAVCNSPRELATVVDGAKKIVSLDTGAAHIAAQLGKPLVVLGTCMGRPWWVKEQYPQEVPFFTRAEFCKNGHKWVDTPQCLNEVSMAKVAEAI